MAVRTATTPDVRLTRIRTTPMTVELGLAPRVSPVGWATADGYLVQVTYRGSMPEYWVRCVRDERYARHATWEEVKADIAWLREHRPA